VLSVVIDAPCMNLIGPQLVPDLVRLLDALESGEEGACRPVTRSDSTSATASEPCD
jgi:hypothetical protein